MSDALVVVDVQQGFHEPVWGRRDNPAFEDNLAALLAAWRERGDPVVLVRHDSVQDGSPLATGSPGNALQPWVEGPHDLLVTKSVNSSFLGEPDLATWLRERGIGGIVVTGIQTNMCCETTARHGANLGFDVTFAIDATHTFDLPELGADALRAATAANIGNEFGRVATTAELLSRPR
jgi:nicotinamidase-related amidase